MENPVFHSFPPLCFKIVLHRGWISQTSRLPKGKLR